MDATECPIRDVRDVGPDSIAIDIETPAEFSARPGQFVKLTFDLGEEEESRFYTISSPDVEDTFEITVEIDPEGTVGPILADLEVGDFVTVSGPFGNDYYEGESGVVVLAGGPGVGPAVGIAERAVTDGGSVAVVYRDADPIHEDRLAAVEESGALVRVLGSDDDLSDAVAEAYARVGEDTDEAQVFVYGFAEFIDDATTAVEAAGGDAEAAKMENFG